MLDIILLGTGGTQPLPERALAAACITVSGSNLLLDCGEGTQTAARRAGVSIFRMGGHRLPDAGPGSVFSAWTPFC